MVVCCLLMYTLMGCSPAASTTSSTNGYFHSPPAPRFSVIPVIRCVAQWCNSIRTLGISPVTTQILLLYNIPD